MMPIPFMARVRDLLHTAGLLHVDETTAHVDGGRTYLHVACNGAYTAMHTGRRGNVQDRISDPRVAHPGVHQHQRCPVAAVVRPHLVPAANIDHRFRHDPDPIRHLGTTDKHLRGLRARRATSRVPAPAATKAIPSSDQPAVAWSMAVEVITAGASAVPAAKPVWLTPW
jgi:hypothetical protein